MPRHGGMPVLTIQMRAYTLWLQRLITCKILLPCLPIPTPSFPSHPTLPVARSRPLRTWMAVTELATPHQSHPDVLAVMAGDEFSR